MPSVEQQLTLLRVAGPYLDRPCFDCGKTYHRAIMEFDHRDGTTKVRNVMSMAGYSPDRIMQEIAKCDVVCANCHRMRTYRRRLGVRIA